MLRDDVPRRRAAAAAASLILFASACGPTRPTDTRTSPPLLSIGCETAFTPVLSCRATVSCAGWYPCAEGVPVGDVTQLATWAVGDPSIAELVDRGRVRGVGIGHTTFGLSDPRFDRMSGYAQPKTIAVFPGRPVVETVTLQIRVSERGTVQQPIEGALAEILDGPLIGERSKGGARPEGLPGFEWRTDPRSHEIWFFGVPRGDTVRLRVSKLGYVAEDFQIVIGASPVLLAALARE